MLSCDIVFLFLQEAYLSGNFSYVESHLSDDYVCNCSAGTINKTEAIRLLKKFLKKHQAYRVTIQVDSSDEENVSLCVYLDCKEKEKFLGITIAEKDRIYKFHKTFKLENGIITESSDSNTEYDL